MKRSRPRQHIRYVRTKHGRKRVVVNKGIRSYGFMFKSTDWKSLAGEKKKREKEGFYFGSDGHLHEGAKLEPFEVLPYVNVNRGLEEMKAKGVEIHPSRERLINQYMRTEEYPKVYEVMPSEGKTFLKVASGFPERVYEDQRKRSKQYLR